MDRLNNSRICVDTDEYVMISIDNNVLIIMLLEMSFIANCY